MKYDGFVLDDSGYPLVCPRCENEEINGQPFCKICALPLVNQCTNVRFDYDGDVIWRCEKLADGNARFCVECGEKTTYYENGLLEPWDVEKKKRLELMNDPFLK